MDSTSILSPMMVYAIIFYMAINIVPPKADQFFIDTQNPKDQTEKTTLRFTKQENGQWKVVPDVALDDPLYFRVDDQLNFYTFEERNQRRDTLRLGKLLKIKKNHKKWKKATEVLVKTRSADDPEKLSLEIVKKGRKQRVIQPGKDTPSNAIEIPPMHLRWK